MMAPPLEDRDLGIDQFLVEAARRHRDPLADRVGPLRVGVDLGTATIVLTVVDA